MHQGFITEVISEKAQLFQAMLTFNAAHSLPPMPQKLADTHALSPDQQKALWENPAFRRAFAHDAPKSSQFWNFEDEMRRLALLDASIIQNLALTFGVALHANSIAQCIRAEEVHVLKAQLGTELYSYAITRARFQLGKSADIFASLHKNLPLEQRIFLHGALAVLHIYALWPQELQAQAHKAFLPLLQKVQTVAPSTATKEEMGATTGTAAVLGDNKATTLPYRSPLELSPEKQRNLWFAIKKILIKELAQEWAHCFN